MRIVTQWCFIDIQVTESFPWANINLEKNNCYMNYCCCSVTKSCLTFCDAQELQHLRLLCPPLSPRVCSNSCQFAQTESVMLPNHLTLCCSLLLLPSTFPSIRLFSSVPVLHIRWANYWSLASTSVLPKNIQGWFLSNMNVNQKQTKKLSTRKGWRGALYQYYKTGWEKLE